MLEKIRFLPGHQSVCPQIYPQMWEVLHTYYDIKIDSYSPTLSFTCLLFLLLLLLLLLHPPSKVSKQFVSFYRRLLETKTGCFARYLQRVCWLLCEHRNSTDLCHATQQFYNNSQDFLLVSQGDRDALVTFLPLIVNVCFVLFVFLLFHRLLNLYTAAAVCCHTSQHPLARFPNLLILQQLSSPYCEPNILNFLSIIP